MTTQNIPTFFRRSRTVSLLGVSLVAILLAAGCSSPSPEKTTAASAEIGRAHV